MAKAKPHPQLAMAEDSSSAQDQESVMAGRPLFRELDPDEGGDLETTEIESLCMSCGENVRGLIARLLIIITKENSEVNCYCINGRQGKNVL